MSDDDDLLSHPLAGHRAEPEGTRRPAAAGVDIQRIRNIPPTAWKMLDKQMWRGASKIYRQYVPPKPIPDRVHAPQIPIAGELPPTGPVRPDDWWQLLSTIPVMWEQPIIFSRAYDEVRSATIHFYEQATPIFQFEVPKQYFLVVQGISYEVENAGDEDLFEITVLRNGKPLARWVDYVIDVANVNPANRYAFGGFSKPIPFLLRFDQDDHLTVQITYKGPKPFIFNSADPFNETSKVNVNGWLCRMRDARSGAPKYLINPLKDAQVNSFQELYNDIPRMASYMKVIYQRLQEGDD